MTRYEALHGRDCSLVLEVRDTGAPIWRHWGGRVASEVALAPLVNGRSSASFSLDTDLPLTTAPGFGNGWFDRPFVLASRGAQHVGVEFDRCVVERNGDALVVRLTDTVARITLDQRFALDPATDVVEASARLTNQGDAPLDLVWLASALLPLPGDCQRVRSFTGRHNAELAETIEPMPAHGWRRENRRGLTGHAGPPGLFVLRDGATAHAGDVFACQLAWSGNHTLAIDRSDEGYWTLQAGVWLAPGEIQLQPGEHFAAPPLLATFSRAGLNGASQNFHAAIRQRGPWAGSPPPPRPVHLNSWEACYFAHDEARIGALAERAAAIGIERFVLDDGWFAGRDNDRRGLGDWTPDAAKYPKGLAALADRVTALGMEFGLWVEPEMVNPDSDLYRAHPDWALGAAGRPLRTARNQLVLDMGRAEVRDYLFVRLDTLLGTLPIGYLKWDHNRDLAPAEDAQGRARYHAQVTGTYALIDRIRAAHPAVEIEACAGGGGRIDAGIAARTHRFWTSDNLDAVSRVAIQRGFLAFMPPELMGAHVGASPAHATGRSQSLGFRASVALHGHFGVELDPGTLDPAGRAELANAIARYKALRARLHSGRVWQGEAADGLVWHAVGEPGDLILLVTRIAPASHRRPQPIRLPMLAGVPALTCHLEMHDGAELPPLFARMRNGDATFACDWLAEAGLPVPPMRAEGVAIFRLRAA